MAFEALGTSIGTVFWRVVRWPRWRRLGRVCAALFFCVFLLTAQAGALAQDGDDDRGDEGGAKVTQDDGETSDESAPRFGGAASELRQRLRSLTRNANSLNADPGMSQSALQERATALQGARGAFAVEPTIQPTASQSTLQDRALTLQGSQQSVVFFGETQENAASSRGDGSNAGDDGVSPRIGEPADRQRLNRAVSRFLRGDAPLEETPQTPSTNNVTSAFELTLPLLLDGRYAGDVLAQVTIDNSAAVSADRLAQLLEGVASAAFQERLRATGEDDPFLPLPAVSALGLPLTLDPTTLQLVGSLQGDDREMQSVSLEAEPLAQRAPVIEPKRFAVGVSFAGSQRYIHESSNGGAGVDPLSGRINGSVNVGGKSGLNLIGEAQYFEETEEPFQRGDVAAFKDFTDRALRVTVGDVNPITSGFQTTVGIGGIGVQRLFAEIQPFRNIRASGRRSFILERPSTVEVFVNGVPSRTLRLQAGSFELTDIPFTNGLNDVVIVVQEGAGTRQEIAAFSQFFNFNLLAPGVNEFEFIVGTPDSSDGLQRYDANVAGTGFFRTGVTRYLTLAAHGQMGDGFGMIGSEATIATPVGVLFGEAAASQDEELGDGYAGTVGVNIGGSSSGGQRELVVLAEKLDERFTTLGQSVAADGGNPVLATDRDYELRARGLTPLGGGVQGAAFLSFAPGLKGFPDQHQASLNLSRSFGRLSTTVSYDWANDGVRDEQHRVLFGLNLRLGDRQTLRAQVDSLDDRYLTEWRRLQRFSVGSVGLRAGLEGGVEDYNAFGGVEYFGNRFSGNVNHERIEVIGGDDAGDVEQSTTVDVETAVAFADGRFAIGRRADRGFVIVSRHPTLKSHPVAIETPFLDTTLARAAFLGPALTPIELPYVPSSFEFDVRNLPLGYDIGDEIIQIQPGAFSGYVVQVGSEAASTVMGVLKTRDARPVTLRGGQLQSRDNADASPVPFFTNRTGRFVAEGVASGTYDIMLVDEENTIGLLEIAPGEPGVVDVGDVFTTLEE